MTECQRWHPPADPEANSRGMLEECTVYHGSCWIYGNTNVRTNLPTGWDEGCAVMRRLDAATADAMRTLRRDLEAMGVFPCEVNE